MVEVLLNVAKPNRSTDNTTVLMAFYSVTPVVHLLEQSMVTLPFSASIEVRPYTVYLITVALVSTMDQKCRFHTCCGVPGPPYLSVLFITLSRLIKLLW